MKNPIVLILAGGEGTRLRPLTEYRSKPAVPFAGRYRLIDVAISNALKKNYQEIYVLTQFLAKTLNEYVKNAYNNQVSVLTADQDSFHGTADSVKKNLSILKNSDADHVVILSGDQLYMMDLEDILSQARSTDADLTIATLPIDEEEARRMGVMKIGTDNKITDFAEKPQTDELLKSFSLSAQKSEKIESINKRIFLGSMGIYVFKKDVLINTLSNHDGLDFGKDIIPFILEKKNTFAYVFDDYWEDIGTIKSYYHANIKLVEHSHSLNIFDREKMLTTHASTLPPPRIESCMIEKSLITDGCIIHAKKITNSLIGVNTTIDEGTILHGALVLGTPIGNSKTTIGKNCFLEKVIVDEDSTIEDNVDLSLHGEKFPDGEIGPITIKDGIIIIKKGSTIPRNFYIIEKKQRLSA